MTSKEHKYEELRTRYLTEDERELLKVIRKSIS
ncbi:hypothetical protein MBGDN05_00497 [Thermoplasmatales archaeon SCGC AB-539-N05]|nr:hypothetical protein MBGDN05_00497 [Thermoplasmatales archaeon SCGC AB-539-N05]